MMTAATNITIPSAATATRMIVVGEGFVSEPEPRPVRSMTPACASTGRRSALRAERLNPHRRGSRAAVV